MSSDFICAYWTSCAGSKLRGFSSKLWLRRKVLNSTLYRGNHGIRVNGQQMWTILTRVENFHLPYIHVFSCLTSSDLMMHSNLKEYLFSNQFSNFLLTTHSAGAVLTAYGVLFTVELLYRTSHIRHPKGWFLSSWYIYIYYIRLETLAPAMEPWRKLDCFAWVGTAAAYYVCWLPRVAEVLLRQLYCSEGVLTVRDLKPVALSACRTNLFRMQEDANERY